LEYATVAAEVQRWARDTAESVGVTQFGFSLAQVEAYQATLAASDKDTSDSSARYQAQYSKAFADGEALGVGSNPYTSITTAQLDALLNDVKAGQAKRQQDYTASLAKQRTNNDICKKFADQATAFTKKLQSYKDALSSPTQTLEEQLKIVVSRQKASVAEDSKELPVIKQMAEAMTQAGILSNPHTLLTHKAVEVQFHQYSDFLNSKKRQIEEEINTKQWKGITPQQIDEINKQFVQYDSNKNGVLDEKEFKACLYSLGNDYDMVKCRDIMKKFGGTEKGIGRDGFKQFMISQFGDADTKGDILDGFRMVCKGKDFADPKTIDALPEVDVKYIVANAPQVTGRPGSYDYRALTDVLFSR